MELALRVDNLESAVPKLYPDTLQAQRLSAQTGPCPTCGQNARLGMGGAEPAKRATDPRAVLPQWDPSARKVPRSGPTSLQGTTIPSTRTGTLPSYLAPSLMPQLHDA